MIFGIDFGTTYTVISWYENDNLKFFKWENESYLLRTGFNGKYNLKRNVYDNKLEILDFFNYIQNQLSIYFQNFDIKNCVLTVPVRFNDNERCLIKECAFLAKFNVIKLIAEPVAAALSSISKDSIKDSISKEGKYIVYDLGGGTFDLTYLNYEEDIFQILKIEGLANYGGFDIDKIFADIYNLSLEDAAVFKENYFKSNLKDETTYQAVKDFLKQSIDMVYDLKAENVNALILAGGSSNIPYIEETFKKNFNVIKKNLSYSVAQGAALYGKKIFAENSFLIDACPFNLGIENINNQMEVVIPKNHPLPCLKTEKFMPVLNGSVLINIIQGEIENFISLKKFEISINAPFEVMFFIDADGIITVKILDQVLFLNLINHTAENQAILEIYNKIKNLTFNPDQAKFFEYIKIGLNSNLNENALIWIKLQYEKLFADIL